MDVNQLNGLTLAYIGDAYYELLVRQRIINLGYTKVNDLHKRVIKYTSGAAQANAIHYLITNDLLKDEELNAFKRGRNSHVNTSRKNLDLASYLDATGFEAMIGYLYLNAEIERIEEIVNIIFSI